MNEGTLVSVVVYTYHSSKTIIETLQSIYKQTYEKIELIVSDDASSDNTVKLVKEWLDTHKERFVRSELKVNFANMGITKHFVKGISYANGKWVKTLAGDDMLMESCIQDDLQYVERHKDTEYLMTSMLYYYNKETSKEMGAGLRAYCRFVCSQTAQKQFRLLLHQDTYTAPSAFFSANLVEKYGEPFNPSKNNEDFPWLLHLTKSGCKLKYLDKPTVKYRQNVSSISRQEGEFFNPSHLKDNKKLEKKLIYPYIKKGDIFYHWNTKVRWFRYRVIVHMGNKRNALTKLVNYILLLLQPYSYKKIAWEIIGRLCLKRNGYIYRGNN